MLISFYYISLTSYRFDRFVPLISLNLIEFSLLIYIYSKFSFFLWFIITGCFKLIIFGWLFQFLLFFLLTLLNTLINNLLQIIVIFNFEFFFQLVILCWIQWIWLGSILTFWAKKILIWQVKLKCLASLLENSQTASSLRLFIFVLLFVSFMISVHTFNFLNLLITY